MTLEPGDYLVSQTITTIENIPSRYEYQLRGISGAMVRGNAETLLRVTEPVPVSGIRLVGRPRDVEKPCQFDDMVEWHLFRM